MKRESSILVVPIQSAIEASNHKPVDDEEGSRKYEKNIIVSEAANCKNTSDNVKVLEDRNHEKDLIGLQSARCKITCDRENLSEREEYLTKKANYKKDRLPAIVYRWKGEIKK